MPRCVLRRRLYEKYLADATSFVQKLPAARSDWKALPRAFGDAELPALMAPLEELLDTYVVYGVAMDLEKMRRTSVLRLPDGAKRPTLDDLFFPRHGTGLPFTGDGLKLEDRSPGDRYTRYFTWYIDPKTVRQMGRDTSGVDAFYERYPLLGVAVETASRNYRTNIELACERMNRNWADIDQAFFPGRKLAHLARIRTTGNDFHKGGKQVLILTFKLDDGSEGRLVYKPSGVEIDCRIVGNSTVVNAVRPEGYTQPDKSLLEIVNEHLEEKPAPLATYVILPYRRDSVQETYGYVQFLTHEPELPAQLCRNVEEIPRRVAEAVVAAQKGKDVVTSSDWIITSRKAAGDFYYQLGALMATALAVSLCDLHVQNVIAHGRRPHLIDLEEALKRPMATISETLLDRVAVEYWDPGGNELLIEKDRTDELVVKWEPAPRRPATCTLYRYDASMPLAPISLVTPISGTSSGGVDETAVLRAAVIRGIGDTVKAIAKDPCHARLKTWVDGLKETIARFVPYGTANYLDSCRALYWKFGMKTAPGTGPADQGAYREFKSDAGAQFFVQAAKARRDDWQGRWGNRARKAAAEWNPFFAVEHPAHAWADYFNGDVPAFYHKLGSRDLLNSRGTVVDVAAADRWQVENLGLDPLLVRVASEYFPRTPVDMIAEQLDALKAACRAPEGMRDYVRGITAGIKWLEGASPLQSVLPRLHAPRADQLPFTDADMKSLGRLVSDFIELDPLPGYNEEDALPKDQFPDRDVALIRPAARHSGRFAYATELRTVPLPRVVAYGFRGDSRKPVEFKVAVEDATTGRVYASMQGFVPNFARDTHNKAIDDFLARPDVRGDRNKKNSLWMGPDGQGRSVADIERSALDLETYLANEFKGGYISLTRDARVARSFACGMGGTRARSAGWVYCCLAEGAFSIPRAGTHPWATKNEAELAMPGMLDWHDIVGFRQVTQDGRFTGPVYLRRSLQEADGRTFTHLYRILSGMKQSG